MTLRVRVCRLEEVVEDELLSFEVSGISVPILVTKVEGTIIAGSSMCPHEDVSLVSGCIEYNTIVCSAHGYAFDLTTGKCTHDRDLHWRRYTVSIRNNTLYVDLF